MAFDKYEFIKCAFKKANKIYKPTYTKYVISEKKLQDLAEQFNISTQHLEAVVLETPDLRVE